ncbi:GNAT family N-acetyltransferase [Candidatus Pacearchaeota archaeon]|nr:GNAT family N-acetyltransferase [Candidatus Pacearchaeota archaeon]
MKLQTKDLILRYPEKKDEKEIIKNINNINVSKWLVIVPYPYRKKDFLGWIARNKKQNKLKKRTDYTFNIVLKSTNKPIGGIGIHSINPYMKKGTIGYWLGEDYWKKGYGTQALKKILDFSFNKIKLRRIEAAVLLGNPSSNILLERFNFKCEGLKRKAVKTMSDKKIYDEYIYGLLKEDYMKLKK